MFLCRKALLSILSVKGTHILFHYILTQFVVSRYVVNTYRKTQNMKVLDEPMIFRCQWMEILITDHRGTRCKRPMFSSEFLSI